jgi:hypothetical protein
MELAFDCRVCKKNIAHKIVTVVDTMPANVHVLECLGCGVLGVRQVSDKMVNNL